MIEHRVAQSRERVSGRRYGDAYASSDPLAVVRRGARLPGPRARASSCAATTGDAYLEFTGVPEREDIGADRDRVRGEACARNRSATRQVNYECVLNDRTNRVEHRHRTSFEARARAGAMR